MKQVAQAFFSLIMAMLLSTLFVCADVPDCRDVPQTQKDLVTGSEADALLLRVYNGSFLSGFADGESIEILTSEKHVLEELLVVCQNGNPEANTWFTTRSGAPTKINGTVNRTAEFFVKWSSEKTMAEVEKKTKADIRKIICLSGESSHDGNYIYCVTDNGDFVLYKESHASEKTYLFPVEEFRTVAKEYCEQRRKNLFDENGNVRLGGSVSFEELNNVSKYEMSLHEENTWVVIAVWSALVLLGVGIVFFTIKRRARNRKNG